MHFMMTRRAVIDANMRVIFCGRWALCYRLHFLSTPTRRYAASGRKQLLNNRHGAPLGSVLAQRTTLAFVRRLDSGPVRGKRHSCQACKRRCCSAIALAIHHRTAYRPEKSRHGKTPAGEDRAGVFYARIPHGRWGAGADRRPASV